LDRQDEDEFEGDFEIVLTAEANSKPQFRSNLVRKDIKTKEADIQASSTRKSVSDPVSNRQPAPSRVFDNSAEAENDNEEEGRQGVFSYWPESYHQYLEEIISQLTGADNDVSSGYDQQSLRGDLGEVLGQFSSLPVDARQRVERALGEIDPQESLQSLRDKFTVLLSNSQLQIIFLQPKYGHDRFIRLCTDPEGKEIVVSTEGHFQHKPKGQKNIYLASPCFDIKARGEQVGLLAAQLTVGVFGYEEAVQKLAHSVEDAVAVVYDSIHHSQAITATG